MSTLSVFANWNGKRRLGMIAALLLPCITSCDPLWTPCTTDDPNCSSTETPRGDFGGTPHDSTTGPNIPLGPLRKLEWRASIPVDASKMKFVGMRGSMPVFWAKDPGQAPRWVVFQTDLLDPVENARIKTGDVPTMDFPPASKISGLDFATNDLLVSKLTFVRLSNKISYLDTGTEVLKDAVLSSPLRTFRDPEVDRFAVTVKPTQSGAMSALLVRWESNSLTTFASSDQAPTALVMGDLDAADPAKNGIEVILIAENQVRRVQHQGVRGSGSYQDDGLESGIQDVLGRLGGSSPVAAGCISDLNGDGKTDLVIARGNELFVSSYVGRDTQGNGQFTDWSSLALVQVSSGQTIRAVSAVNLASDSLPELVVETESFVHFYLNKP